MGDQLAVDLDGIEHFANQLDVLRNEFNNTPQLIGNMIGRIGGPEVQNALHDFDQKWATGREVLDSYLEALAKMGHESVTKIRATDHALAAQTPTTVPAPHSGPHGRQAVAE